MRSLHKRKNKPQQAVDLVLCSLGGVQESSTQTVPGPFPDIPVEGRWQARRALEELAGKGAETGALCNCAGLGLLGFRWLLTCCSFNVSPAPA